MVLQFPSEVRVTKSYPAESANEKDVREGERQLAGQTAQDMAGKRVMAREGYITFDVEREIYMLIKARAEWGWSLRSKR